MVRRLFGVETEYAFAALRGHTRLPQRYVERLMSRARARLTHLPGSDDAGIFLSNGGRLYVDTGAHPELATPECTDPWEIVRYIKAGDLILERLCEELESSHPSLRTWISRGNVDYSGTNATWGCHESYLHRAQSSEIADQLVPHLVSRIIFCGAGGFNPRSPGLEFTLSPRAWHLEKVISGSSTRDRGIFHTKNESLCGHGYHRLHVLCGDSPCSELGTWLMIATTALVVALTEAGAIPGDDVELADPLAALRSFAADVRLEAQAPLANGGHASAISIQRHFLSRAEIHLGRKFMPPWAEEACRHWRSVLDRLEENPQSLAKKIDWSIKLALYSDRVRRRQMDWDLVPFWSAVLSEIQSTLTRAGCRDPEIPLKQVLTGNSPIREEIRSLTPRLKKRGLRWDDIHKFLVVRSELLEVDTRYGQLGSQGVFAELDRSGVLEHRVPGVDDIEHATAHPPVNSRARVRGEVIRQLGRDGRARCGWHAVWDRTGSRVLDLSDPFEASERWRPISRMQVEAGAGGIRDDLIARLRRIGL